jgi:two-component system, OmpR family, sensor kinase
MTQSRISPRTRISLGLRGRLLLSVLIVLGLVLAALTAGFNIVLGDRLNRDANGVVQARAAAELATLRLGSGRIALAEAPDEAAPDTQIWVFQGTRALESPPLASPADSAGAAAFARGAGAQRDVASTDTRLYALPVVSGGRRLGTVIAGVSLAPYEQTRRTALIASAILALVAFIAVALAAGWLTSRALRPVARMTAQAAEWSDRDLDRRFALGPPHDELTQLASTLDQLLDRLAASLRHEQRLSAELSHELRTPLANIVAQAQFALRHTRQDDDGCRALEQVIDSARQMGRTLDTLIAAARAELDPHQATSDAAAAVRAAMRSCAPLQSARSIETSLGAPDQIARVAGEQALVERILAPVIENAYRHAAHTVAIAIAQDGVAVSVAIEDDGLGIPAGEQEAIFEPGRRVGVDGSPAPSSNGAGLGLALSRRLARSAGGDVNAEQRDDGARFVIRLPAA